MSPASPALAPGSLVGDLQVERQLGGDDFGLTYVAADPALGSRFLLREHFPAGVATRTDDGRVRPLDPASAGDFAAGLEQFLAEGRLQAALEHAHVARVLRYFRANGTAYLLVPYTEGETLDAVLASRGSLSPAESRALFLGLADALEYLHEQGILHLDLKPANVFLTAEGEPLLMSFGAAAARLGQPGGGTRAGTPNYRAPEQAGAAEECGPWTDIYGLAATLLHCLTGQAPVDSSLRTAALESGAADPLGDLSGLLPPGISAGLAEALSHGLELQPAERPRGMAGWRHSLTSLDWRAEVAAPPGAAEPRAEGREWLPPMLLGAVLAIMVAVALYLWFTEPAATPPAPSPAAPASEPRPSPVSAEEQARWQAALEADTVLAYRRFLGDYPDSIYAGQAGVQLAILDDRAWEALAAEDTREAYVDYLDQFPDGKHAEAALKRIDAIDQAAAQAAREKAEQERREAAAWETAANQRTLASMDGYLQAWPNGKHADQARQIRRELQGQADDRKAFEAARNLDTRDAWQAYVDAFPKGAHVADALQRIDQLTLRPGKQFRDCADCPLLAVVPAGSFLQGSGEDSDMAVKLEQPAHTVTFATPFAVGVYEVTMAEWDACVAAGGCAVRPPDNGWGRGRHPVIMVSWDDAQAYLKWLSESTGQEYRLPSESEWEYVARAGQEGDWLGGSAAAVCEFGNVAGTETGFRWQHAACADKQAVGTAPAGSFRANRWGLYDVIGNVAEWTADCTNLSYLDAPVDGSAWGRGICSSHMTRGGSWVTGTREIRLPARFSLKSGDRNDFTGFRVVRTVKAN